MGDHVLLRVSPVRVVVHKPLIFPCHVAYYGLFALDFHSFICLFVGFTPSSRVACVCFYVFAGFSHISKPKHARDGGF